MGLFKKKRNPIDERAQDLKRQLGALEDEIRRLSAQNGRHASHDAKASRDPVSPLARDPSVPSSRKVIPRFNAPPRLRSAEQPQEETLLHTQVMDPSFAAVPSAEPIFEEVRQNPFRSGNGAPKESPQELGIRRRDLASFWKRFKNHFRGPVTSNPKLVNYLAAGSIQGLQPLRYERRIARNRFIALVVILVLILWGVLALLLKR